MGAAPSSSAPAAADDDDDGTDRSGTEPSTAAAPGAAPAAAPAPVLVAEDIEDEAAARSPEKADAALARPYLEAPSSSSSAKSAAPAPDTAASFVALHDDLCEERAIKQRALAGRAGAPSSATPTAASAPRAASRAPISPVAASKRLPPKTSDALLLEKRGAPKSPPGRPASPPGPRGTTTAAASTSPPRSPPKSPPKFDRHDHGGRPPTPPVAALPHHAHALFYDDNALNFKGVSTRGRVPAIQTIHCVEPMTTAQLQAALDFCDAASHDETVGELFYFFDFDQTLNLLEGFELETSLESIFGKRERRVGLRKLLTRLLATRRCWVLTANRAIEVIALLLNETCSHEEEDDEEEAATTAAEEAGVAGPAAAADTSATGAAAAAGESSFAKLSVAKVAKAAEVRKLKEETSLHAMSSMLMASGLGVESYGRDAGGPPRFVAGENVLYVEQGRKIKAIQQIVAMKGFKLVTVFR